LGETVIVSAAPVGKVKPSGGAKLVLGESGAIGGGGRGVQAKDSRGQGVILPKYRAGGALPLHKLGGPWGVGKVGGGGPKVCHSQNGELRIFEVEGEGFQPGEKVVLTPPVGGGSGEAGKPESAKTEGGTEGLSAESQQILANYEEFKAELSNPPGVKNREVL